MKMEFNKIKKQRGITLIALVITIIVLLILAGVSIALLRGDNGILTKASSASEQTKQQGAKEKVQVAVSGSYGIDGKIDKSELKNNLNKVEGISQIVGDITLPQTVTVDGIEAKIWSNGKVTLASENVGITDGEWNGTVNSPKLGNGMEAVYWDENGNEVVGDVSSNWYNYGEKKWANAKTSDGSYWVWIPRYEYQITSGEGTSTTRTIDINFISTQTTTASANHKIHPAFQDGRNNKYANGEWDKELSGIWVMKFEASSENPEVTDGGGDITSLKVKSVPGVPSWRSITVGNSYTNSYNYDRTKDSHLMKNSEWGAIAYLTNSIYGTDVKMVTNLSYYTGGGLDDAFKTNVAQSTTGNVTGIYNLAAGNWERVAAYVTNGHNNLKTNGESFATKTESTKYVTVYPWNKEKDRSIENYTEFALNKESRYGDAILETSDTGSGLTSWLGDYSYYPCTDGPFFMRGGRAEDGAGNGIFSFSYNPGSTNINIHFRTCLAF